VERLQELPAESINCCVTSPPYFGLRSYLPPDHLNKKYEIGNELTPEEYVSKMVEVFREVRRVLRKDGILFLNLGDSYAGSNQGAGTKIPTSKQSSNRGTNYMMMENHRSVLSKIDGLKPKDLVGIPWYVAFALREDGYYLRQDIIWCISGGTYIYAKTQKGVHPLTIKDIARLKPCTVELWTGKKWTRILGTSKSKRSGNEIEFVLRSGERISCTPKHKFPTHRGLLEAKDIKVGDILDMTRLPDTENPKDCVIDNDAAWFAGLYLAEGSRSDDGIQISGHSKEIVRWEKLKRISKKYGGRITRTITGNCMNIRMYGKILNSLLYELVSGKTAKNKCFGPTVWNYSNKFIESFLDGYLSGDGCWEEHNNRWRLGFTRNYNLERDLRTACARLGYKLTLKLSVSKYQGGKKPSFKGELRKDVSKHFNNKQQSEVIKIRKARCREVYDLGIEDDAHIFSLSSGILTHNSKPNAMPESVLDRCTKSHEYLFMLSKSRNYYYDADAIREPVASSTVERDKYTRITKGKDGPYAVAHDHETPSNSKGRNKRSVWSIPTQSFRGQHYAIFPEKLIEPCLLAGCPTGGTVLDPFAGAGTTGVVAAKFDRNFIGIELNPEYAHMAVRRIKNECPMFTTVELIDKKTKHV
jgi:DNA modification methylase